MKRAIILLAALAMALPMAGASATSHCRSPISFLSGTGLLVNPRAVGCEVIAEDLPGTPNDDSNTDWIIPGSGQGIVRWNEPGIAPADGSVDDEGNVLGSRIETSWAGTSALRFTQGTTLDGEPADFYDSQDIPIGRSPSLTGVAVITVCRAEAAGGTCETVTYRGIAAL